MPVTVEELAGYMVEETRARDALDLAKRGLSQAHRVEQKARSAYRACAIRVREAQKDSGDEVSHDARNRCLALIVGGGKK